MKSFSAIALAITALAHLSQAAPAPVAAPAPQRCWWRCSTPAPTNPTPPTTPTQPGAPVPNGPNSSYNGGNTANDVTGNTGCRPLTYIFARGTTERGNLGSVIGPPVAEALQAALGRGGVSVQGVDYPADSRGNANLGASGGPALTSAANRALQACPSTKLVISGYSQGAMVVHNALSNGLSGSRVAAITVYGDPLARRDFTGVPANRIKSFCANGDNLCDGSGFGITPAHLTYGRNAQEAADFILQTTGLR